MMSKQLKTKLLITLSLGTLTYMNSYAQWNPSSATTGGIFSSGNVGIGISVASQAINGKLHLYTSDVANSTAKIKLQRWEMAKNTNLQVELFGQGFSGRNGFIQFGAWNQDAKIAFVTDNQANVEAGTS